MHVDPEALEAFKKVPGWGQFHRRCYYLGASELSRVGPEQG